MPAEDPALIPERLAELALAPELTGITDPAGGACGTAAAELARRDRWVVVFDNAEDPRALSRFLPEGAGQVLITSRNPAWRGIADTVGVREFTRGESIALLRRRAPDLTEDEADRVAEAVGDLPLAVEQAGSLLADTGMAADKYLRLLAERAQDVLDHDPGGAYPRSVAASWAVAFDRLAADDPTALDLLAVVAWCGPEPVPLSLLVDHPDALPDLLQPIGTDPLVLARCTAILRQRGAATYLLIRGELQAALAVYERAYAVRCDTFGKDHPDTLTSASNLALSLYGLGEYHRARPLDEDTLTRRRRILGEDRPDTLKSASQLASDLFWLVDFPRSRELQEEVLGQRRRILGADHPDTLTSASQLSVVLWWLGDNQGARQLLNDTATRYRRVLGESHPDTLAADSFLAVVLWTLGDYREARRLLEDSVTGCRRVLGEDHPVTLRSATFLGMVLWSLGDPPGARRLLNDLARSQPLRPDHGFTRRAPAGSSSPKRHPHSPSSRHGERPPRNPPFGQQTRGRSARARRVSAGTCTRRGHSGSATPDAG